MSNLLHVCLYNVDPSASEELGKAIRSLNFVRLVGEVGTPEELAHALQTAQVNLVFFHLDPQPDQVVEVIDQVAARYPELGMIALSHQIGPEAIIAPMRAGCDQFVCEPIDTADLANAVSRVASKRLLSHAKSRCICVTGASGGAGATSIACNLALEIAHLTERECALLDLDLHFGTVALSFDQEPRYSLYDLAVAGSDIDHAMLASTLTKLPCGVDILSRPEPVEQRDIVMPETIYRVVELLMADYENIIIDTPRDLSPHASAAFTQAELILIVCQLVVPSIRNTRRYYDALLQLGIQDERIEFVVNRSDGRSGRVTLNDLEDTVQKPVYACIPNDYHFVARSVDFGRPVAALDQTNPVRVAIRQMARKATHEAHPHVAEKPARRSLLGRFLAK